MIPDETTWVGTISTPRKAGVGMLTSPAVVDLTSPSPVDTRSIAVTAESRSIHESSVIDLTTSFPTSSNRCYMHSTPRRKRVTIDLTCPSAPNAAKSSHRTPVRQNPEYMVQQQLIDGTLESSTRSNFYTNLASSKYNPLSLLGELRKLAKPEIRNPCSAP
jgi:hypothetical protein